MCINYFGDKNILEQKGTWEYTENVGSGDMLQLEKQESF